MGLFIFKKRDKVGRGHSVGIWRKLERRNVGQIFLYFIVMCIKSSKVKINICKGREGRF